MPQNFAQVRHICITVEQAGQRVDNFLIRELRNVPRSHIYRLLRSGQVRVNGGRIKPTRKLLAGDDLRLPPVRDVGERNDYRVPDSGRKEILTSILHEDDELLVLNKPAGWAVHAGTGVPYGVVDALRQAREDLPYLELAHRLDRETSGCLLFAKSRAVLDELHSGFRHSEAATGHEKRYLALLAGRWQGAERSVDLPLISQRLESGERMVKLADSGAIPGEGEVRSAHSEFSLVEQWADCCLMAVRITTGRMHQIRVHAQAIGHPVMGDRKYGDREINQRMRKMGLKRMFLHAERLGLTLQNRRLEFSAPLAPELTKHLERLRNAR